MLHGAAQHIRSELLRVRDAGRVHGAYLLEGPPGTGKRETALWFGRLLLCPKGGPDPCESCAQCRRSALHEAEGEARPAHPDFYWVEPQAGILRVEQIRALERALGLVANEGGFRVAVMDSADRLRREAANALLKTLEEPPSRTCLLLVAERPEVLPPTIRSRTVRLRFVPEREEAIEQGLQAAGVPPEEAWLSAALGGGSLAAAQDWAGAKLDSAREFSACIEEIRGRTDAWILDFAQTFRGGGEDGRRRTELFLDVHAAVARRRVQEALREGRTELLDRWLGQAEQATEARRELRRRNLNAQMLVETLLLGLKDSGI